MKRIHANEKRIRGVRFAVACAAVLGSSLRFAPRCAFLNDYLFNDSHFHLTNYIQEGTDIHDFLEKMGTKVGRVALVRHSRRQQQWSWRTDADLLRLLSQFLMCRSITIRLPTLI